MRQTVAKRSAVPGFMAGLKIPFRGRMARVAVCCHDGVHVQIGYRNGVLIDLPAWVGLDEIQTVVANVLKLWLKRRVRPDDTEISTSWPSGLASSRSIPVGEMKTGWGPLQARSPEGDTSYVSSPDLRTLRWATPQLIPVRTKRRNEPRL
jgi:hypothetical protein